MTSRALGVEYNRVDSYDLHTDIIRAGAADGPIEQRLTGFERRVEPEHLSELLVGQLAPEAVATEQEAIVRLDVVAEEVRSNDQLAADGSGQHAAARVV